jgi:hypothetical protein
MNSVLRPRAAPVGRRFENDVAGATTAPFLRNGLKARGGSALNDEMLKQELQIGCGKLAEWHMTSAGNVDER